MHQFIQRAFPGRGVQGNHCRAHDESMGQAGVKERRSRVFTVDGDKLAGDKGRQKVSQLAENRFRTGQLGADLEVVRHFGRQRFVWHHNGGVNQLKQHVGRHVVPEAEATDPQQWIDQHQWYTQQNKETATLKQATQSGVVKVITDVTHHRVADGIDDTGNGENGRRFNQRKPTKGGIEIHQSCAADRQCAAANQVCASWRSCLCTPTGASMMFCNTVIWG